MEQANSLSRRADWAESIENNDKNQVMSKKKQLEIRAMKKKQLLIEKAAEEIIEDWRQNMMKQ